MIIEEKYGTRAHEIAQLKDFAKHPFAFPGGYPLFAITNDGGDLCHKCCKDNYRIIRESQNNDCNDGWNVSGVRVNWESEIYCDNCNDTIESAYGSDENE